MTAQGNVRMGVVPLPSGLTRVVLTPPGWVLVAQGGDGSSWMNGGLGLMVILSAAVEADGLTWLHLSCSHRHRIPAWEELVKVKELFLGVDTLALQVIPPRAEYVNLNPLVLHLWCCLDRRPTPDFTQGTGSL